MDRQRRELAGLLDYVRDGDQVFVHGMDRLAKNFDGLGAIVLLLNQRQVSLHFLKAQLTCHGEDGPMAILLLSIMGAFVDFESVLIKGWQREGIALAKSKGYTEEASRYTSVGV